MTPFVHAMIGDLSTAIDAVAKTAALFLTAALLFRFFARRALSGLSPFDWIAAVAAGAIVGRSATASDISWLAATAALIGLLIVHRALTRLRFIADLHRLVDPPPRIIVRDGQMLPEAIKKCGLITADLESALRQHGYQNAGGVQLAVFEASGAISVIAENKLLNPVVVPSDERPHEDGDGKPNASSASARIESASGSSP
ncbi:DUF421 domain-containing protein [Mycobacterium sp. 3519A]|uniref:DUF421 domain-containing protein n=1 Tax=Mycobacterium sp. 3519A TaxID=2057184 RepID=UPI000C7DFC93|nr:YetF domain-containing protein [Mycobacterium sp. 3519A]